MPAQGAVHDVQRAPHQTLGTRTRCRGRADAARSEPASHACAPRNRRASVRHAEDGWAECPWELELVGSREQPCARYALRTTEDDDGRRDLTLLRLDRPVRVEVVLRIIPASCRFL